MIEKDDIAAQLLEAIETAKSDEEEGLLVEAWNEIVRLRSALNALPVPAVDGKAKKYRLVGIGEKIQEGDEVVTKDGVTWEAMDTIWFGTYYQSIFNTVRRPVNQEES